MSLHYHNALTDASKSNQRAVALVTALCLLFVSLVDGRNLAIAAAANKTKTKAATVTFDDKALLVDQSNRFLVLPPGKSATVWFEFQNLGTSTWTNKDPHPVSLNTDDPMRRKSMFEFKQQARSSSRSKQVTSHSSTKKRSSIEWRASWRPARMLEKEVAPGETGKFRFALTAPKKPGVWREKFVVVREQETRIAGGEAEFVIVVGSKGDPSVVYQAKPKLPTLSWWVKPGERVYKPVEFRNIGYATWRNAGFGETTLIPVDDQLASQSLSGLTVQSSPAIAKPAPRAKTTTAVIDVVAPATSGQYRKDFGLSGPYGLINGSRVTLELNVTEDPKPVLDAEPMVRVGVYAPIRPVEVAANGSYEIRLADSNELIEAENASTVSTITYDPDTQEYDLSTPTISSSYQGAVRFVPTTPQTVIELKSFSSKRVVSLDGEEVTVNDNQFRGVIEVRYAQATKKLWVINELPIELYLRGLAETSNAPHTEFTKALITAARTYALFHISYATKHKGENFHINSTTDQLYRGYNFELRTPNITSAVEATRGLAVTHPAEITEQNKTGAIVAAYSSCTDGRTRSYEERWGGTPGARPYLISVPDPNGICSNQRWLQGLDGNHMVGMSATGALKTSEKDGLTYDALLKYYYTGVSITKAYP